MCAPPPSDIREGSGPLELELQPIVSHLMIWELNQVSPALFQIFKYQLNSSSYHMHSVFYSTGHFPHKLLPHPH